MKNGVLISYIKKQQCIPKQLSSYVFPVLFLLYFIPIMDEDPECLDSDFVFPLGHSRASDSPLMPPTTQKQPKIHSLNT